jgi:hypothetical protein
MCPSASSPRLTPPSTRSRVLLDFDLGCHVGYPGVTHTHIEIEIGQHRPILAIGSRIGRDVLRSARLNPLFARCHRAALIPIPEHPRNRRKAPAGAKCIRWNTRRGRSDPSPESADVAGTRHPCDRPGFHCGGRHTRGTGHWRAPRAAPSNGAPHPLLVRSAEYGRGRRDPRRGGR